MVRGRSLSCSDAPVVEVALALLLTAVGDVGDGRTGDGTPLAPAVAAELVELFDAGLVSFPVF